VIVNEVGSANAEKCVVALINPFGDPIDMRVLFKHFYREQNADDPRLAADPNSIYYLKNKKMQEHKEQFKNLLKKHKPAIILLTVTDKEAQQMKDRSSGNA